MPSSSGELPHTTISTASINFLRRVPLQNKKCGNISHLLPLPPFPVFHTSLAARRMTAMATRHRPYLAARGRFSREPLTVCRQGGIHSAPLCNIFHMLQSMPRGNDMDGIRSPTSSLHASGPSPGPDLTPPALHFIDRGAICRRARSLPSSQSLYTSSMSRRCISPRRLHAAPCLPEISLTECGMHLSSS